MIPFIDLETSGLDKHNDTILEFAMVITDDGLTEMDRMTFVVDPSSWTRHSVEWHPQAFEMHKASGLFAEASAGAGKGLSFIEDQAIAMLEYHNCLGAPLAGSTIDFDRAFIDRMMPDLARLFHYRSINVSTVTELAKRFAPVIYAKRPGADDTIKAHRSLPDILMSIEQLRYYRDNFFVPVVVGVNA